MTLNEIKDLILFARTERVQELVVGDVHVLFAAGAMRIETIEPAPLPKSEAEAPALEEDEAAKLLDGDDDLFRHVDGPPDVVSQ